MAQIPVSKPETELVTVESKKFDISTATPNTVVMYAVAGTDDPHPALVKSSTSDEVTIVTYTGEVIKVKADSDKYEFTESTVGGFSTAELIDAISSHNTNDAAHADIRNAIAESSSGSDGYTPKLIQCSTEAEALSLSAANAKDIYYVAVS